MKKDLRLEMVIEMMMFMCLLVERMFLSCTDSSITVKVNKVIGFLIMENMQVCSTTIAHSAPSS
jgi:hypothetical protein